MSAPAQIDPAPEDIAARLMHVRGLGRPLGMRPLPGGRNNRVFRVETRAEPLILKCYFNDARDLRDRLAAEWNFLRYAWDRGFRGIPEPLASERALHAGLYSFVPGRKLAPGEVSRTHVDAAIALVLAVNAAPRDIAALPAGSEACFTLAQHLETIERRVRALEHVDTSLPSGSEARAFIANELAPKWHTVRAHILRAASAQGGDAARPIAIDQVCLSPSDFGFHNALIDATGAVTFLDFEYAGRDDPAKLVSDFFCQPEIPVPLPHLEHVLARLSDGLRLSSETIARCRILLDAYRIKWSCILLNDFLPLGAARRAFADPAERERKAVGQLAKARAKVAEIA